MGCTLHCGTCATPRLRRAAVVRSTRVTRSSTRVTRSNFVYTGHARGRHESSLHESAKGKLVWKDGGYFHDEFGRTGLFSSGVGSAGDPLGHSYQYGERICDYYLGALELPKPSDPE